jgi:ABC-type uncharacterized transport system permease subunit
MGARATFSYPLAFWLLQIAQVVTVLAYYFLERIVKNTPAVGGDYLAFAAIGLAASQITQSGIMGLGQEIDQAIQQGRLEMLLIEPVRWSLIPVALSVWPTIYRTVDAVLILVVAAALGAVYQFNAPAATVALFLLGISSGLVIGVFAAAVRVLAKRGDPIATLYSLAALLISGQFVPINTLPTAVRAISWTFPAMWVISGLRKSMMPNSSYIYGPDPNQAILISLAFTVVFLPLALWVFGRSLEYGRRYGVLAGY